MDGIRTFVVLTVGSDLLQSHETFNFVTLKKRKEKRKKKTLWMIPFKFMRKNTAWHLILAAVRVQLKTRKVGICAGTRIIICLFNVTVQTSLRLEICFLFFNNAN